MRNGILGTLGGLLASAGLVLGQSAPEAPPPSGTEDRPSASAPVQSGGDGTPRGESRPAASLLEPDQVIPALAPAGGAGKQGDPGTGGSAPATGAETGKPGGSGAKIAGLQPVADAGTGNPLIPSDCANGCCGGGPGYHFETTFDYLIYFQKNPHALPALVIGGGAQVDSAGNVIVVTTGAGNLELAGGIGSSLQYGLSSGGRLGLTYWWDQCPDYGLEITGMFLGKQSLDLRVDNGPVISRPFFNADNANNLASLLVAFPGVASGSVTIHSDTRLAGGELNALYNVIDDPIVSGIRANAVLGLRYLDLAEGLRIQSVTAYDQAQTTLPQFAPFAGQQFRISDIFNTRNQFFGVQTGAEVQLQLDIGTLTFRTDLAFGTNHEELNIQGSQLRVLPNGVGVGSFGGLLALPSNIGRRHREQFAILPEFNLDWLVPVTDAIQLHLGYQFIYLDRVIRPGDQIDPTIDLSQVPNYGTQTPRNSLNRPAAVFTQGDYYVHGFSMGLEFRW